jgi:hypothetical protein
MKIHSGYSCSNLEIKGQFHIQGMQDESQIPKEVVELFKSNPDIVDIAVNFEGSGQVYSRNNNQN